MVEQALEKKIEAIDSFDGISIQTYVGLIFFTFSINYVKKKFLKLNYNSKTQLTPTRKNSSQTTLKNKVHN